MSGEPRYLKMSSVLLVKKGVQVKNMWFFAQYALPSKSAIANIYAVI